MSVKHTIFVSRGDGFYLVVSVVPKCSHCEQMLGHVSAGFCSKESSHQMGKTHVSCGVKTLIQKPLPTF